MGEISDEFTLNQRLLQWRARNLPCPLDMDTAAACTSARQASQRLYWLSVGIFAIGVFFALVVPLLP